MKKKMDAVTKAKLIYSVELGVFAIAFLVIAILKFTLVIPYNELRHTILNWITLFGGAWVITDFLWGLLSKKRRPKIALIDKIIHLPVGIYLIAFDLFCLIAKPTEVVVYQCGFPIALSYLALCYSFEAIYHFFYPVPGFIEVTEEEDVVEGTAEVLDGEVINATIIEEKELDSLNKLEDEEKHETDPR